MDVYGTYRANYYSWVDWNIYEPPSYRNHWVFLDFEKEELAIGISMDW